MANIKKLPLFVRCMIQNFPFIEEDFDALTNYELISKVIEYLNKIITSQNEVISVANNLQESFIQLQTYVNTYFDNLDVQEEINNKLDAMVEAGTLQEIITAYIQANVAWSFDNVADMKTAENFVNGSFAQTLGYHTKNDGGTALYKIRTITNDDVVDEKFIIALEDDSLIAELILFNDINVKQLGAYGDGIHNDTDALKAALSKNNISIYIPSGTYLVNEALTMLSHTTLYGDGSSSVIKCSADLNGGYLLNVLYTSEYCTIKELSLDGNYYCNGIYDGKNAPSRIGIRTNIHDVKLFHCIIGVYLNAMGSMLDTCYIYGEYTTSNSGRCTHGIYINQTDNEIINTRVLCYTEYGIYCISGDSSRMCHCKIALCGVGVYLKGEEITASSIVSQENFQDNFVLYRIHSCNLNLTSAGAGVESQNGGDTIPTTLNSYSDLKIDESNNSIIRIACNTRTVYGTETWSCAG